MPRKRLAAPNLLAAIATALAAFAVAAALREAGLLERVDLAVNDRLVRTVTSAGADDRFFVVLEREEDLTRWGFPLSDDVLATLIEKVSAAGPLAVAIDKYRDKPVAPGTQRLDELLARADRVFWVSRFGVDAKDAIPAPAALKPAFVGCADLVDDPDGAVRRALIYLDQDDRVCYSLAFQLARFASAARGLPAQFAEQGNAWLAFGKAALPAIDPRDGPYVNVDTAGFQVPVPSAAGLPSMPTAGLTDLLEGRVAPNLLRGRIVLFGSEAQSLRDFFNLPSAAAIEGHDKVAGVQAHALVASYLLRAAGGERAAMRLAPGRATLAFVALLALGAALIACSRNRPLLVLSGAGALLAVFAGIALLLAAYGVYLAPAAPAAAIVLAAGAGIARSAWLDNRERAELMLIFSRHVSREVADAIWERRTSLIDKGVFLPRQLVATIFFLDIRGFTTVFERLPPERAVPWLNRGLGVMTETVMHHQGVVTRFIGDSIMAVFGAPLPRATEAELAADARNAIAAGLALGRALDALNREYSAEGLPPIRVRVGINTGTMTQCSVGTHRRMEFTLLGDAVNTASRLESFAMEDDGATARILIGERTMQLAGAGFATRAVGSMILKGKEVPVMLYQVLGAP